MSKNKISQNLEKINWRIGENKFEKRSHEWINSYKTLFHSSVNIYLPYFLIFSGHQGFKCIYHNFSAWETEIKFKYMQLLTFTWSRDTIIIQLCFKETWFTQRFVSSMYRKHWKSCVGFQLFGQIGLIWAVQLKKYETAPNFIQLTQNLTSNCLLIYENLPVFTSSCMMWS